MVYRRGIGLPGPGNLRTPFEGIDLVADEINRLAALPGEVVSQMADSFSNTVEDIKRDLSAPREQPERPIPPDVLLSPIPKAIGDAVSGAIGFVKSGVDAVVNNVEGARRELEDFVRG